MKRRRRSQTWVMGAVGLLAATWLALLAAPHWDEGLLPMLIGLSSALTTPFRIVLCPASVKVVLTFWVVWGLIWLYIYASWLNTRYGEEHGSAQWGETSEVRAKLAERDPLKNRLYTQNIGISYNFKAHRRNLNTVVVGGSGAGKTRSFVMPNILQANCSMVILDPKGELLQGTGGMLEQHGVTVKVLDLIEMEKSWHYNPFRYLRNENDVQTMATNLFEATTPKEAKSQDPFWDEAAKMLLLALSFFLWMEAPPEEQNFAMVMELLRCAAIENDDDASGSPSITDILFQRLEDREPNHIAVRYYRSYRGGSGKTLKSIQLVLAAHLAKFNLSTLAKLTETDDLDLRTLGEKKTALFCRISDADKSYNFLVSQLYLQLFQQLFECADLDHRGRLPVHVHFLMDEFPNVALPDNFENYLSTMRSRNMSASVILQNIAQLKALFEKKWESIIGNCDEFLYLGGNEQSTHEYVSKLLGKETIWTRSNSLNRGSHGSAGRNDATAGRELMTPDEVAMLDNRYCILKIRGFRPIMDEKLDINTHPNVRETEMGGAKPYLHDHRRGDGETAEPVQTVHYEVFTEAELDALLSEESQNK